jgi:urocanate reductase
MKKLLALILIGMMLVNFTACSSSTEEGTAIEAQEAASTEGTEAEAEADADAGASIVIDESGLMVIPEYEVHEETELEQTYDVVVVGAGGAGLTAAISAAENGAKVLVLEQESIVGGNTSWSGAGMDIPDNWVQAKQGIEDSIELYTEDTLAGGDRTNIVELTNVLAENALPMAEWLRDDVGVKFMDDFQKHFGGHTVARAIVVEGGIGSQLIMAEFTKAQELGVMFKLNTKATDLVTVEAGRVTGVKAENTLGQKLTFNGDYGVILASGGFAGNPEIRVKYRPELDETINTTNAPGHNGDGIVMAEALGAGTTHMEWIQTYPFCFPTTGKISFVADTRMYGAPMVNIEGKRFINENDRRDFVSAAILSQSDRYGYMVWDQEILEEARTLEIYGKEYDQLVADGVLVKADTLEEAAAFFGIDQAVLMETIANYNSFAAAYEGGMDSKEADTEWNRNAKLAAIDKGPFYIEKVVPAAHHTMGGLLIDTETRVKTADGDLIAGLYAAGEIVGGIHGNNRLGGNALTDISVFGKIAGETVVSDQK